MMNAVLENEIGWRYSCRAPHKTGAGIATPNVIRAHNRANAVFLCAKHGPIRIMVGRMGPLSGGPGSRMTGCCNPVRLTTHEIATSRGELINLSYEDAIMATVPALSDPEVTIENGRAVTTSVAIAEYFRKRHDNVIQKIKLLDCSPEFSALNFKDAEYTDEQGKKRPSYQITKNGFVFLVMGFTGKKAAAFKEAYIAEFDRMENELLRKTGHQVCDNIIHGDGHTLVIRFDEHGNIISTQKVPKNAWVCTIEDLKFFLEKQGWTLINRNKIKRMTVEQLLSLK
ncbi:TPA: transcriptional regulator [Salmonella enterica subsp. salamae]|nr:transcriptional regulator [Salmonella enterica subsp. salamae]